MSLGRWFFDVFHRLSPGERRAQSWRRAADACGLTELEESTGFRGATLEGKSGMLHVRLEPQPGEHGTRVIIGGLRHDGGLELKRGRGLGALLGKELLDRQGIDTGDGAFDDELDVMGSPALARALLDEQTRLVARQLMHGRIEVAGASPVTFVTATTIQLGDKLWADIADEALGSQQQWLPGALRTLLDTAHRLERPDNVAERLANNATSDPLPAVRLHGLLTLLREYPKHPATREALRVASKDGSDEIRLRAGIALHEEGHDTLLELAFGGELATGSTVDDAHAARAVVALGDRMPRERTHALLESALLRRRVQTACACIDLLGRSGAAEEVQELVKVVLTSRGQVAVAAVRALGASGLAAAERPLLDALGRGLPELRVPVVEALGRLGTVEAVTCLRQAEARYADDRNLRHVARQAIAKIQSRLTGASPGQLSLAESQGGRLSLAETEAGRLSLTKKEGHGESG